MSDNRVKVKLEILPENLLLAKRSLNKGGKRGRLWFERMKPDYKDSILNGVKKIVRSK